MKKLRAVYMTAILILFMILAAELTIQAQVKETYFMFILDNPEMFEEISRIVSIDRVRNDTIWAYAVNEKIDTFADLGIPYTVLPHPGSLTVAKMATDEKGISDWDSYPSFSLYKDMMYGYASSYPSICRVVNIGSSEMGRDLLFIVISDNVYTEEDEPEVMYTATMHGDEVTGYPLMLRLADSLLTAYGSDSLVTRMVDSCEIWINPLANPDGTFGTDTSVIYLPTRTNSNGIDLNRHFPDPRVGPHPDGEDEYQSEVAAMMQIAEQQSFVISANIHGGAEVFNYPWDTWTRRHADDGWWQDVGHIFADSAQYFSPSGYFTLYPSGITNGSDWYIITGGRQDYMNYWHKCREVTLEISNTKFPSAGLLPGFWNYLHASWINYLEQALYGVRGIVTDATNGEPLNALVTAIDHDIDSSQARTDPDVGDYHRMLEAGTYDLVFTSVGYIPDTVFGITVTDLNCVRVDVAMMPLAAMPDLTYNGYSADLIDPGDAVSMGIDMINDGPGNATNVSGILSSTDEYINITQPLSSFTDITAEGGRGSSITDFEFTVLPTCPLYHFATFRLEVSADNGYLEIFYFDIGIGLIYETFESGDFSAFDWQMYGAQSWVVVSENPYQGAYCAKSGPITDGEYSRMTLTVNVTEPGLISFRYKVSSENGWDWFRFYSNNSLKGQWSGEIDWSEASYEVAAGIYTFKWHYVKDGGSSSGSDCVWIDKIALPPNSIAITISTDDVPDWTAGVPYMVLLEASGGTGNLTWTDKYGNLAGTGLSLSTSGQLSGTPSGATPITFTAQVTDEGSGIGEKQFSFTINDAVSITTTSLPDGVKGESYSYQLEAAGGTGTLSWSDKNGDLTVKGFELSSTGLISGTPSNTEVINFTARVTDQPGSADEKQFALTVGEAFMCGDVNDDELINLTDILNLISYVYLDPPGPEPIPWASGDVNNADGFINLTDILWLISYVYNVPPGPEPSCN